MFLVIRVNRLSFITDPWRCPTVRHSETRAAGGYKQQQNSF